MADDAISLAADNPSGKKLFVSLGFGSGACAKAGSGRLVSGRLSSGRSVSGRLSSGAVFSAVEVTGGRPERFCIKAGPAIKPNSRIAVMLLVILAI